MKKRSEHGLESWVLFIDLVKAFDKVPRDLLWKVLRKFGVPEKIVRLLISLHCNFDVQFSVDGVVQKLRCSVGVKQGDVLGPILFNFYIAAIMSSWRKLHERELCLYRSKEDFVMTGRKPAAAGEEFPLLDSEYADDAGVLFPTRHSLATETPKLIPSL